MIRITIFYPNSEGTKFDMAYYTSKHMPMAKARLGPACKSIGADLGVSGGAPGTKPTYIAIGYMTFDTVAEFEKGFGQHAAEIVADVPNYTNARPIIQISEIKL
jgi:uncharacterized protein (TIGR02118 family)